MTSALDPILLAGRQYWITISSSVNYAIVWNNNSTGDKNAQAVSSDGGATWFAPTGATPGALEVNGIFIPEPSAGLLAGSGLIVAWRRKRMPGEGAEKRPDRN